MTEMAMSRRYLLAAAGAGALAGVSGVACNRSSNQSPSQSSNHEDFLRKWYAAWQGTDWAPVDAMTTDDFTFTSAAGDDHISKATFKKQCWDTQLGFIAKVDLEQVFGQGNETLVKYNCHTKNGKSFRNVEYFRFRDDKIAALECYFGGKDTFPSAVSAGQKG
jgi:ketosteroid isomerase-like protein